MIQNTCFCLITKSCLTPCDPCPATRQASLSFTVSWSLLRFMSIESVMPSKHLILCCHLLLCLRSFPALGSFPMSQFFVSGGQRIGVSTSASVLPMNIQGQLSLGLTGLISLQSKRLSRVFSNTTIQKLEKLDKTRKARKGRVINACGPSNCPFLL